ncbi:MAG: amidohydrolase family protein [Thermodesulfovibrionales bacterium]|jgi:imidazolonepropionase-like amidohydrolase
MMENASPRKHQFFLMVDSGLIIPPFEDSHIHFTLEGRPPAEGGALSGIRESLLSCGITSVREMGHKTGIGLEAKKSAEGTPLRIKASGIALYKKGTYGVFLGKAVEKQGQIPGMIREIAEAGADILKVVNSGIVSPRGEGMVTPGGFSSEEMRIIGDEARERGLEIACHVNGDRAIRDAVLAGVSSVEHGFFVSTETLMLMQEKGVSWTPTAYALSAISSFIPETEQESLERIISQHLSAINMAASIGVRLRVGTDSGSKGVPHGKAFIRELRMFQKAGLTLKEILAAACLDEEERRKGSYLIIEKDFLATGIIRSVVMEGKPIILQRGR